MDQTEHSDLDSVLQLLARQTDEEKLAGLLLLTQRVDFHKLQGNEPEPEAARQKVYKSIGRKYVWPVACCDATFQRTEGSFGAY